MERCFHCHAPVPQGTSGRRGADDAPRYFCCPGCRAVAELIETAGLARYYEFRSAPGQKLSDREAPDRGWGVCDRPEVRRRIVRASGHSGAELRFGVDGVNCAACVWLIDRALSRIAGVNEVSVNPLSREALVSFDPEHLRVSEILEAVEQYGFTPQLNVTGVDDGGRKVARDELKRLAVAGLGFAQVMMLSAALYLGAFKAMDVSFSSFFVIASMLIATPVVLYSGAPIFRSALRDLSHGRIGMDVPVSLAIAVAMLASLVASFRGAGHVYFDSATMFVFFLTLGRFLEARARHRAGSYLAGLGTLKPLSALRVIDGKTERIGTIELVGGDIVLVGPGEPVPADGELLSDEALVDESILSGESLGRRRRRGERLLGGSLNTGHGPLELRVSESSDNGYIEQVGRLLQRAIADRPDFLRLADRWATVFVAAVLAATAVTGMIWLYIAPGRALAVVLAMLVVTCPCALSLAAPTAFAVALGQLARLGLLCRSARVLERLGRVSVWFFDKTGTVTEGRFGLVRVDALAELTDEACLAIAAALEAGIEHPIARALAESVRAGPAEAVEFIPGYGVTGRVDGVRYLLGSARHVGLEPAEAAADCVYLARSDRVVARFMLADRLRPHAREAVSMLAESASIRLVSGDSPPAVASIARSLAIDDYAAAQTPADKLELLREQQQGGAVVATAGDGINDAPLLAQSDVSIAMLAGSQLAQASADVVFTGSDLRTLARLPALAAATCGIVRQNLTWAVCYNLAALPLAAAGVLQPWMAALGMSLSSLIVVGNALRLNRMLAAKPGREPARLPDLAAAGPAGS